MIDNQFSNHDFSHYAAAEKDMCGIWAVFGDVNSDITQQISACMKIAHRGPDQFKFQNLNLKKNAVVGFHRLAVMDTHHQSMQPFQTLQHLNYLLCYNGEIYNHKSVSRLLLHNNSKYFVMHQKMIITNECCLWCMSFVCISTYLNDA